MTNPTTPAVCEAEIGNGDQRSLCGRPATWTGTDGPRCGHHSLGTTEELPGDGVLARRDALVVAMRDAKGTVDAKAAHTLNQLEADGWLMLHIDGGPPVQLGPGEQIHGPALDGHHWAQVPDFTTTNDDELDTLASIVTDLERMAPDARERVAVYLTDRYGPTPPPSGLTWPAPAHVTRNGPGFTDQRAGDWTMGGGHA